ncbi:MAG: MBL fold metallo-hydrolase [Longimicrobiales bacterium]
MKLRFLGTGTSFGVPVIGCRCGVCTSQDPRDNRTRHAALVTGADGRCVLVDTPPELRIQLLAAGVGRVDAVWFTHDHADHTSGMDDLRVFSARSGHVSAFAGCETAQSLRRRFAYIFDDDYRPPDGTTKPEVRLTALTDEPVEVAGMEMLPLRVPHGDTVSHGFRTGPLGYVTDAKSLPGDVVAKLRGVRILVLNALWFGNPHPTHFNVEEAIEAAAAVGAERTFLTHLTHRVLHSDLLARLPRGVEPAYDGLTIEL